LIILLPIKHLLLLLRFPVNRGTKGLAIAYDEVIVNKNTINAVFMVVKSELFVSFGMPNKRKLLLDYNFSHAL
jgi:hypothetical protein